MFIKGTVAAGVVAAVLAFMPDVASAKTKIHVGIGGSSDWCYYNPYAAGCGYGYYRPLIGYYHAPRYYRPQWHDSRISCGEAREIVREHGFRNVRTRSCGRTISSFIGVKRGDHWLVKVNTGNGRFAGARRL